MNISPSNIFPNMLFLKNFTTIVKLLLLAIAGINGFNQQTRFSASYFTYQFFSPLYGITVKCAGRSLLITQCNLSLEFGPQSNRAEHLHFARFQFRATKVKQTRFSRNEFLYQTPRVLQFPLKAVTSPEVA